MSRWRELAQRLKEREGAPDSPAASAPIVPIVPIVPDAISHSAPANAATDPAAWSAALASLEPSRPPSDLVAGLDRLRGMRPPRITRPEAWPEIVADALRIAEEGWAAQAIALGWQPLDLWGCWPFDGGDDLRDGLAISLGGRAILAVDERMAAVRQGKGIAYHYRPASCGDRVFLWTIGGRQ